MFTYWCILFIFIRKPGVKGNFEILMIFWWGIMWVMCFRKLKSEEQKMVLLTCIVVCSDTYIAIEISKKHYFKWHSVTTLMKLGFVFICCWTESNNMSQWHKKRFHWNFVCILSAWKAFMSIAFTYSFARSKHIYICKCLWFIIVYLSLLFVIIIVVVVVIFLCGCASHDVVLDLRSKYLCGIILSNISKLKSS